MKDGDLMVVSLGGVLGNAIALTAALLGVANTWPAWFMAMTLGICVVASVVLLRRNGVPW